MMLKFKVFSIYLREGNTGFKSKSSVCQYMYNKASGGSAPLSLLLESVFSSRDKSLSWHKELEPRKLTQKTLLLFLSRPSATRKLGALPCLAPHLLAQECSEDPKPPMGKLPDRGKMLFKATDKRKSGHRSSDVF